MKKALGMALVLGAVFAAVTPAAEAARNSHPCGSVSYGAVGVIANDATTCGFARNVARAYMRTPRLRTHVWAWSSATAHMYRMWCRPVMRGWVICTGGNNARVALGW